MNELLIEFALPILSAGIAWFANAYRNKQKKEKDILDNVQQIIDMQKEYITSLETSRKRDKDLIQKLESKFEKKCASIRKAYSCKMPSENCPVLISDEHLNDITPLSCDTCELKKRNEAK